VNDIENEAGKKSNRPAARKSAGHTFAEWVSLGISTLLILSLAVYLVIEAFRADDPFVPVGVEALVSEARQLNGQFVLPVRITNRGGQTLRDLKVEVRFQAPGTAAPNTTELLLDYVGEGSEQIAYLYLDQPPGALKIEGRATSYRVD
jgi:uncharacterized protein (TIGR02588 family)